MLLRIAQKQTPGPLTGPGVLRDDCSPAPLDPSLQSALAFRGKGLSALAPRGLPAEDI